jgi:hypothetical protein
MGRHRTYAIGASLALSVEISFEIARILVDRPWMGVTPFASHVVSGVIATLCFAAAVILPARRENLTIDSARWVLGVLSVLALSVHTAFTVWQHDPFAVVPLLCAVVTGICIKRTFDRGELALGRPTEEAGPSIPPPQMQPVLHVARSR